MAFSRFWAIILLTFAGLGTVGPFPSVLVDINAGHSVVVKLQPSRLLQRTSFQGFGFRFGAYQALLFCRVPIYKIRTKIKRIGCIGLPRIGLPRLPWDLFSLAWNLYKETMSRNPTKASDFEIRSASGHLYPRCRALAGVSCLSNPNEEFLMQGTTHLKARS